MSGGAESVIADLRRLLGEIDGVLQAVVGELDERSRAAASSANGSAAPADHGAATDRSAADRLQESLGRARERLGGLEQRLIRELQQGWESTDRYVRDNAWVAIGAAAVIGFFAGAIVSRRR